MRRFALGIQISFVAPSSGWGGGGGGGRGRVAAAAAAAARRRREDQWPSIRSLVAASTTRTKVFVDWQLIISSRARRAAPRPSRARARARSRPARPASLSPVELDNDAGKSFCLCRVGIIATSPTPAPPSPRVGAPRGARRRRGGGAPRRGVTLAGAAVVLQLHEWNLPYLRLQRQPVWKAHAAGECRAAGAAARAAAARRAPRPPPVALPARALVLLSRKMVMSVVRQRARRHSR